MKGEVGCEALSSFSEAPSDHDRTVSRFTSSHVRHHELPASTAWVAHAGPWKHCHFVRLQPEVQFVQNLAHMKTRCKDQGTEVLQAHKSLRQLHFRVQVLLR